MDFKERFKGRTTTMKKEGAIETFATSINPVMKSPTHTHHLSSLKSTPPHVNNPQTKTNIQFFNHTSTDYKPTVLSFTPHSFSKSPIAHSHTNQNTINLAKSNSCNTSALTNPYLVSNPFPSLEIRENHDKSTQRENYHYLDTKNFQLKKSSDQQNVSNELHLNKFNNQGKQFRNDHFFSKENIESQNYNPTIKNQALKGSLESSNQHSRQRKIGEEVLKTFENQNHLLVNKNSRYDSSTHNLKSPQTRNNVDHDFKVYSRMRDIHSNPTSNPDQKENATKLLPGNLTYFTEKDSISKLNPFYLDTCPDSLKNNEGKTVKYRPYSLKDYSNIKSKALLPVGGLGPNINTDEWQKEKEKRGKMMEFSQNVKLFNAHKGYETNVKPLPEKEKSKRDIALQFARNIQRPKLRNRTSPCEDILDLHVKKSESDAIINYRDDCNDLDEFEQRHLQYMTKLEKLKLT